MWFESSPDCLARLAHPDISVDIAAMISDHELAVDFRFELLEIVRYGRLSACAGAAISIIESNEPENLKAFAASAIGAMDDSNLHARLFQAVCRLPHIPNRLCAVVVQALFPKSLSPAQLAQLLAKTETVREFEVGLPYDLKSHFKLVVIPNEAAGLLKHLNALAQIPPLVGDGKKTFPVSKQFYWIGNLIPTVLEILLQKPALSEEEMAVSAASLQLLGHILKNHHFDRKEVGELNTSTLRHPGIRRSYFWLVANEHRKESNQEPTMLAQLFNFKEVLSQGPEDFSWLVEEIHDRAEANDRLLVLHLAIEVWDASGRTFSNRRRLRRAIAGDASLRTVFRKSVVIGPLFPLKKYWRRNIRYKFNKWWWASKLFEIRKRWDWIRWQFNYLRHLQLLESGKMSGWLAYLVFEANEKCGTCRTPGQWSDLEKKRGQWITRATKRGCRAAWRRFRPDLPHEKLMPNTTDSGVIVGLTGLQVEFDENPEAISNLTEDEAGLAARYAMDELKGFPTWYDHLAALYPLAVGNVLCECIEAEWRFPDDQQRTHEVLAKLTWHGEGLIYLVKEKLLSLLNVGDPPNRAIMQYAISILMRHVNPPLNQLAQFADQRTSSENDPGGMALWLSVWMHIDGQAAITRLASILQNSGNPDDFIIRICSILSGEEMERGPFSENPSYLHPTCLRDFIPLVYRHVRISDDLDRSGGAYSPTARDHAQNFRSVLLNRLENDEDPAATDVLKELVDDPAMILVRDWIFKIIDKRMENEADSLPWTPADIRDFEEQHEVEPKNDRELFAIARKRLRVLKWDVELSDNSMRTELHKDYKEIELRRWLQRKLNERSRNRYTVPQEAEIDQQERPDLRLEKPGIGSVSIEVKWAENWTLPQLLERLENQLVGQYLRAHNSRYGIYFLGFIGKQQHWKEPTTGRRMLFEEVVTFVRQHADSLMRTNSKIAGLEVVSIDFSQPKKQEKP